MPSSTADCCSETPKVMTDYIYITVPFALRYYVLLGRIEVELDE